MKTYNILECIRDPKLLGHGFKKKWLRGDTWKAWRSFCSASFGLPFEDAESFEIFKRCTGRVTAPTKQFREVYPICGRRSGKSYLTAACATYRAAFVDYSEFLSPGEVGVVAIVAADKSQAGILLRYVRGFFQASPVLRSMVIGDLKETIRLNNNIEIQILAADYRSCRGRTLVFCEIDELAFLNASDGSANPDSEVLAALRPGLISIPNSLLIGLSSPWGKRGALYEQFQKYYGKDSSDDVLIWKADSRTMNPSLSENAIQAAYDRDPVSARTEFGSEFREDLSGFLTAEVLETITKRGRISLPRLSGVSYSAFADLSGGRSDSATLAIGHEENGRAILDVVIERAAPHVPQQVTAEFCGLLKRFGISVCTADRYSAEWAVVEFSKNGITLRHSDKNRSEIYLEFLPAATSQQVELLDHPKMIQQFLGLERRVGRNQDSIDHAPGQHDDLANSVAGVLTLVRTSPFWPADFAHEYALQSRKDLQPLATIEEEKAAIVAGGVGMRREPAKHDRRFGAQRIANVATSAAIQKPTLAKSCPQCNSIGLSSAAVSGPSGNISQSCGKCGWSAIVPGRVGLRFH